MELLCQVNEKDELIGAVERKGALAEDVLHRAGMVFLKSSDGRLLVQQRSKRKEIFPGCCDAFATFHVTFGETYAQAAARELREETGVKAEVKYLGKFTHHDPPEHQVVAVFVCSCDAEVRIYRSEPSGFEFRRREELGKIVGSSPATPWLRDGWKLAREKL